MAGEKPVGRAPPRRGTITSAAIAARRLGGGRAAGRGERAPGLVARLRSHIPRVRPLKVVTVAAFGAALFGIVANAMVFQRGHHPSPLFGLGRSVDGAADAGAKTAAAVPPPAPATPVERTGTIPPVPASPVEPAPAPAAIAALPKPAPVHRMPAKARHEGVATAKPSDKAVAASDHPRPGHAPAHARPEAKPDTLVKLLADPAHGAKAAKPDAKPAVAQDKATPAAAPHVKAEPEPPSRPHRRAASGVPAKPAAETE